MLEVELEAADPAAANASAGRPGARKPPRHDTGLLFHLPQEASDPGLFDYAIWPPLDTALPL
jgi:hypothetical protein